MKKWKILVLLIVTGIIIGLVGLWPRNPRKYYIKKYSEKLDIDLNSGKLISYDDSHGGLDGDGLRLIIIDFSETGGLTEFGKLKDQPVSDNMSMVMWDIRTHSTFPAVDIPKAGYYYFENKNSGNEDVSEYKNFVFAMYEADKKLLYVCEWDN